MSNARDPDADPDPDPAREPDRQTDSGPDATSNAAATPEPDADTNTQATDETAPDTLPNAGEDGDDDRDQKDAPETGETPDTTAPEMDGERETDRDTDTETEMETEPESDGHPESVTMAEMGPMSEVNPGSHPGSDETDTPDTPDQPTEDRSEGAAGAADADWRSETVDQATRQRVLRRDHHRCRFCGACGPGAGGQATLQIHHIDREPDHCDLHDPENLTTLCESCHSWMHKRPSAEAVPVELTAGDKEVLLPYDYEILRVLAMRGPATVGEITEHLYPEHSRTAIRERLWTLMALDNMVETRASQLVDQDAHTGEWALIRPGKDSPLACSARGYIPEDDQTLRTRVEDELVRQALRQGCNREVLASALGITSRTTWHKERRAQAYDIPLQAVTTGPRGSPGRGEGRGEAD